MNLPAKLEPGDLVPVSPADLVPALIAGAGEQAAWRYIDFFTANIHNPKTRRAYVRACNQFFAWWTSVADRSGPCDHLTWRVTLRRANRPIPLLT